MKNVTVQQRGTITLPKKIRDTLGLEEGSVLRISHEGSKITLESLESFHNQLISDVKQSLVDLKNGDFVEFSSIDELHSKAGVHDS